MAGSSEKDSLAYPLALMLGMVAPPARPPQAPVRRIRHLLEPEEPDEEKKARPPNARREKIFALLSQEPLSAHEIADALHYTQKSVTDHLRLLLQADRIERIRGYDQKGRIKLVYRRKRETRNG